MRIAQSINAKGIDLIVETPTQDDIGLFYLASKAQGLLPLYLHEGIPSLMEFVAWNTRAKDVCFGYYIAKQCDGIKHLVGMVFYHSIADLLVVKRIELGLCFFRRRALNEVKEYATPEIIHELIEMGIDWCFQQDAATCLFSHTPVKNRASLIGQRGLGFECKGILPKFTAWFGESCDSALMVLTNNRWFEKR